jgi:hypothetical protein
MCIEDQRMPFLSRQALNPASTVEFLVKARATVEESASVPWIAEDACHPVVFQVTPADFYRTAGLANQAWKL